MRKSKDFITSPRIKGEGKDFLVTFILLSENHGYRMKSKGAIPLVDINGKSLIERQVEAIKAVFSNFEIIICCGYDSKKVFDFVKSKFKNVNIRIVENQVYENSNCCESARIALNNTVNNRIFIMNGSLLVTPQHLSEIDWNKTCLLTQESRKLDDFEIGVVSHNKVIQNISLGLKSKKWLDSFYLYGENDIRLFHNMISSIEFKNRFLFEAIGRMIEEVKVKDVEIAKTKTYKIHNIKSLMRLDK